MEKFLAFGEKNWNVLAVAFGVVMVLCVAAKKFCGCFADTPVTPFAFYALLALLSIPCRKIPQIPEKYWYPICLGALAFPFFCFLLGSLGFLIGISLTKWHGVVALLLAVGVLWKLSPERKVFVVNLLVVVGLWLGCLGMASLAANKDIDTSCYHKPAAILMAEGWNPVWDPELKPFLEEKNLSSDDFWFPIVAYFSKGQWILSGVTFLFTGILDAGDYVNLLLILVCVVVFYHLCQEWLSGSSGITLLASFLLVWNPVTLRQMSMGRVDGNLNLCFLLFLLSSVVWLKTGNRKWLPFVLGSAIYGCTLKHTAPVYFGLAGMLYSLPMVWEFFSRRNSTDVNLNGMGSPGCSQRGWWCCMGTIFLLVLLCSWNPYVTNTWNHTSPFYPLHTLDSQRHPTTDIMKPWCTWDAFQEASGWQKFFYTFLILRTELPGGVENAADVPVDVRDISFFSLYERGCQWGIFPLLLIFSMGLLFLISKWDHWLVLGAILLTIVIQPHPWWDRYVPQIYALPVLILMILQSCYREYPAWPASRWTAVTVFFLGWLFLSSSMGFLNQLKQVAENVLLESKELALLRESPVLRIGSILDSSENLESKLAFQNIASQKLYARYYLDQCGLEEVAILPTPTTFPDNVTVYHCFRWIYTLPRNEKEPPQNQEDVFLDYSDVHFAELPEALKTMAKIRWKQIRNTWCGRMISG